MKNIAILILLFLYSCNNVRHRSNIKTSFRFDQVSEEVLKYYSEPKDSLKYNAALFLIENMNNKYGVYYDENSFLFNLLVSVDSLRNENINSESLDREIEKKLRIYSNEVNNNSSNSIIKDIDKITSEFLIENIEYAFKAWEMPWSKDLTFDEFCQWILPYRVISEPLQNWRRYMYEKITSQIYINKSTISKQEICHMVNNIIASKFQYSSKLGILPMLGGIDAWKYPTGDCVNRYQLVVMAMRSIGLPVAIDYTPQFPTKAGSHSWTVLLDSDKKTKAFNGGEIQIEFHTPNVCPIGYDEKVTSVRRYLFEEMKTEFYTQQSTNDIPITFRNFSTIDVTDEYDGLRNEDIEIKLSHYSQSKYLYLFSFDYSTNLNAVYVTKNENSFAYFKNVSRGGVYIAGYFKNNVIELASEPFYIPDPNGVLEYIIPDLNKRISVKPNRKFYVKWTMKPFVDAMIGAKIEGANNAKFNDARILYVFNVGYDFYKRIEIDSQEKYRFYRYKSSDSCDINIAELTFNVAYENGSFSKLNGPVFGFISNNNVFNDSIFSNAFDRDIRTCFNAPSGSWIAADAGEKVKLNSIEILARNHLNVVEPNDYYELLYFDSPNWISLGVKMADDYYVEFDNVPMNALLLLKDLTKGKEERIFQFKNNVQVWR